MRLNQLISQPVGFKVAYFLSHCSCVALNQLGFYSIPLFSGKTHRRVATSASHGAFTFSLTYRMKACVVIFHLSKWVCQRWPDVRICTSADKVFHSALSSSLLVADSHKVCVETKKHFANRWMLWSNGVFVPEWQPTYLSKHTRRSWMAFLSQSMCLINAWNDIKTLLLRHLFKEELFIESDRSVLAKRWGGYTHILQGTKSFSSRNFSSSQVQHTVNSVYGASILFHTGPFPSQLAHCQKIKEETQQKREWETQSDFKAGEEFL